MAEPMTTSQRANLITTATAPRRNRKWFKRKKRRVWPKYVQYVLLVVLAALFFAMMVYVIGQNLGG
jgi:uncharacterized membrane protein